MSEKNWVDFTAIKTAVDMQMVLSHYGVANLRKRGDELRGPCPIHKGSARSQNFCVNTSKNAFKCFSKDCGSRGNVLDFVAAMEHCSVRDAAIKLRDLFKVGESQEKPQLHDSTEEFVQELVEVQRGIYQSNDGALYEVVIPLAVAEDGEHVVVYREMFGEYRYCVCGPQNFAGVEESTAPLFNLVKPL